MNIGKTIGKDCIPRGTVCLPPSKSLSHRALICAAMAGEGAAIKNIKTDGEDVAATLACLEKMGLGFLRQEDAITVTEGIGGTICHRHKMDGISLDCGESGSTLRFLIPLLLLSPANTTMTGRGRLLERPLKGYLNALEANGGKSIKDDWCLRLQGPLRPGIYELPGNLSSQFVSGLLMILPLLEGSSKIRMTTALESEPYVDMTIDVMRDFDVTVERRGKSEFLIPGEQVYAPADYKVEGDYSAGAYFLVAGALGCDVGCRGLSADSAQGDKEILNFIRRCGGRIEMDEEGIMKATANELRSITADISQCPDLAPPLSVLLCFCKGESRIVGAGRLRMKESDRLRSISESLNSLGAKITEGPDYLTIQGVDELYGGRVDSHNDHRIAMAAALASIKSRGAVTISDPECVNKSYPAFFRDFCGQKKEE